MARRSEATVRQLQLARAALLAVLVGGVAAPGIAQDWSLLESSCAGESALGGEVRLGACTTLIESGRYKGEYLGFLFHNRAYVHATRKEWDNAIRDYGETLKHKPNDAETLDSRGFTYLKMGRLDAAIADYDAALKAEPKHANALDGQGIAWRRKGDEACAKAHIEAATAIQADIGEELARRGAN